MSNSIKGFVRTTAASLTMASTVLSLAGFAAFAPVAAHAVAPADFGLMEGDTIRATGDVDIFIVNAHGYKRLFVNPAIFNLYGHLGWAKVKEVSPSVRDAFGTSGYFTNAEANDGKVYSLECVSSDVANLHWLNLSGADAVSQDANFFKKVFNINNNEQALYGVGSTYTSLGASTNCQAAGPTPSTSGGPLQGGAGSVDDVQLIGTLSSEEVGEGESNVKVLGLDIDADNGSDLRILSVKLSLEMTGSADSDNLDDFADGVSLWYGSSKVADVDVDDFNETGGVYSKSISLSGDAVVKMDSTGKLYVAVSAIDNIDSGDLSEDWTVTVDNIRYVDAQGAISTDDSTGDLPASETFTFESFASAADLELEMKEASSNPVASVVEVASESDEDGVLLLAGTLKAKGGDITVKELTFDIATSGADLEDLASVLSLEIDGDEVQSINQTECSAATVSECVFDDVDYEISENDTVDFKLYADINATENYTEGSSLTASIDNDAGTDAEDQNGDSLAAGDKTGSVDGEEQAFQSWGIMVTLVSTSESKTTGDSTPDEGTFVIKFKATAFGGDVFVEETCDGVGAAPGDGVGFDLLSSNVASDSSSCTLASVADDDGANGNFEITEGSTEEFTLTVVEKGANTFVSVLLQGIEWATSDIAEPANLYDFNLDEFETDDLFLSST